MAKMPRTRHDDNLNKLSKIPYMHQLFANSHFRPSPLKREEAGRREGQQHHPQSQQQQSILFNRINTPSSDCSKKLEQIILLCLYVVSG